jgi:RING finger protein 113A
MFGRAKARPNEGRAQRNRNLNSHRDRAMSDSPAPTTVPFFRKKARPTTTRRRSPAPDSIPDAGPSHSPSGPSEVARPVRKSAANPLIQGTKRTLADRERDGPDVKWQAHGSNKRDEAELQLEVWEGEEAQEVLKKAKFDADKEDMLDDGLYRGQASYKTHIKKREEPPPKSMRIGPQRSTNTIKTVTLVDYQPDVCKDYKGEKLLFAC